MVAPVIQSLFYQLIISSIHGAAGDIEVSSPRRAGADFQIFSFMFPATMPDVWGRAERPPNDDRKREFVNSKSNYLGEITFGGD